MSFRPIRTLARTIGRGGSMVSAGVSRIVLSCTAIGLASSALAGDLALPAGVVAIGAIGVRLDPTGPVGLVLLGLTAFATAIAVLHVRARKLWNDHFEKQRALVAELQLQNERMALFVAAEPQILVNWDGPGGEARIEGDPKILGEGITSRNVTRFGDWLGAIDVSTLRSAVDRLREQGEGFSLQLNAQSGSLIEIEGRPVAGRAIMRLRAVTGERLEKTRLTAKVTHLNDLFAALKDMLNAIPQPVWLRGSDGRLAWVNTAYVRAVEAKDNLDVIDRSVALLERSTLDQIDAARLAGKTFQGEVQAVVAGRRRALEIVEVRSASGRSGGIATDVTELEAIRRDVEQQNAAHVRTIDQLQTAVVLFGQNQRMSFYNRAFNELWQFDAKFLETRPTDSEMLDRLRADGKLPEHADFREWKLGLQQSLNANETLEDVWLLPNGRSLRVVTSPSTAGGVTYLFDDITEQMHLAQNYNRLASMQGETLDSLTEGVAVFGSHGRLQLHNPAFASLWNVSRDALSRSPHIDDVARLCPAETQGVWHDVRSTVCGLPDERVTRTFETKVAGDRVLALVVTPLPEGASLLTVEDVTSTVNAARMLKERNDALESAARFRSEFIHNVSFELRLPLTSVIGISQMLAAGTVGPLNDRQRAYANDLIRSTDSVMALLNDILALTSIESTGLELTEGGVDLRRTVGEAMEGLKDRFGGAGVELALDIAPDTGVIRGDARRIRQILFSLIANAVASSDPGDTVRLSAHRTGGNVEMRIADRGSFDPTTGLTEERRRSEQGQSLRVSIARSLVELHHGQLTMKIREDGLREVSCILPAATSIGTARAL